MTCLDKYARRIAGGKLWAALNHLEGKTLACECPPEVLCEADVLRSAVYISGCEQGRFKPNPGPMASGRTRRPHAKG